MSRRSMVNPPAIKAALKGLLKASDALRIPDLQSAIQSLVEVIRPIEKINQNDGALQALSNSLRRLRNVAITPLSTAYHASGVSPELQGQIESLFRKLDEIANRFIWLKKYRRGQRSLIGDGALPLAIVDMNEDICASIDGFSRYSQTLDALASTGGPHCTPRVADHLLSKELEGLRYTTAATHTSISEQGLPLCSSGTREAILNTADIWLNDNHHKMLILKGSAGTGKSTIARTIATLVANQHRLASSFFFSKDDASCRSPALFFPTIAFQLAQHNGDFAMQVSEALRQSPDMVKYSLGEQFDKLIVGPLNRIKHAPLTQLIIVDGLDECDKEGGTQILWLLVDRLPKLSTSIKILITIQPESHFQSILSSLHTQERIHLDQIESAILEDDMRRFLHHQLSRTTIQETFPDWNWELKPGDLNALAKKFGRTFLECSIVERFIKDASVRSPQSQIDALLESIIKPRSAAISGLTTLDHLYTLILERAFQAAVIDTAAVEAFHFVVGTIVVLEVPLPLQPLCRLLDADLQSIATTLSSLTPLIDIKEGGICLRIRHHTFTDFITTPTRCPAAKFLIKPTTRHEQVVGRCFDVMAHLLKRNICQIPSSDQYLENDTIIDLGARITEHIPQELDYACCYWAAHLSKTPYGCQHVLKMLEAFVFKGLLSWLELLSLIGKLDTARTALKAAEEYYVSSGAGRRFGTIINDALHFVDAYYPIIERSALHIYHSALSFAPSQSKLFEAYSVEASNSIRILQGRERYWRPLPLTMREHQSYIYSVVFSLDDTQLVSAGGDKAIRLWDAATGSSIAELWGHASEVYHATFSPDGTQIVSASRDLTVRLWSATTRRLIATMKGHSKPVNSATFSPDGTLIASASTDMSVRIWDVASQAHKATLEGHSAWVRAVVFSPDGTQLASASGDRTVKVWNIGTRANTTTLVGHSMEVRTVVFSPDGSLVATGSDDNSIRIWDAVSGVHRTTLNGHSAKVWDIKFSPDGTLLASGSADSTVRVWDVASKVQTAVLQGHSNAVRSVSCSHDGSRLASSSQDQTLRVWDISGSSESFTESHSAEVDSVTLSPGAKRLVSASGPTTMLWNSESGSHVATLTDTASTKSLTLFSPDGSMLASSPKGKTILLWMASAGFLKATLDGHTGRMLKFVFSRDGTKLASASLDSTIRLWDPTIGVKLATLECPFDRILCVTLSTDGTRLAVGSDGGKIQMWNTVTREAITMLEKHSGSVWNVVFSRCGTQLASACDDGLIVLWDGVRGDYMTTLEGHSGSVLNIAFSPDGNQVASGSTDSNVRVWKGSSRAQVALLEGHFGWVWDVAFSPEGSRLASASDDLTIRIWDIASNTALVTLEGHYCYPDLSGIFSEYNIHVVKRRDCPAVVRLHNHHGGPITQVPLCWLPPKIKPVRSHFSEGVLAIGTSTGRILCLGSA